MGLIEDELAEVKKLCEHVVPGTKLVSCVRTMVRAEIKRTDFKKIIVCIQFPLDYPKTPLLIELKSKTLSDKLLQGLSNVCEQEIKKSLGKPQILLVIKFLRNFIDEHPLLCCYDEINELKKLLNEDDILKLKQKTSSIALNIQIKKYYFNFRVVVPDNYPLSSINIQDDMSNFTPVLHRHIVSQAKEIARQCVEPPIKKKPNAPKFEPGPSLKKAIQFMIDCVKLIPNENCQFCKKNLFPEDPELLEKDENSPKHIERVYCGHFFHQECFNNYMKLPPFGNKKCNVCGKKISHYKWSLSDKLAEDRWAHEQARERELQEVTEFFQ